VTGSLDRRALLRTALGASTLGALAACGVLDADSDATTSTSTSALQPVELQTLAMIGDSITFMSQTALQTRLGATFPDVVIDAQVGRRITVGDNGQPYAGTEVVDFIVANTVAPPDVWVIALGTNDVAQYAGAADYRTLVDELLAPIPADAPLVWVNVYYEAERTRCQIFNLIVLDELADRPRTQVADWYARAVEEGVIDFDGVHPTTDGINVFAAVVGNAVEELVAEVT
jgi:lysophospholipase L1-like esterase